MENNDNLNKKVVVTAITDAAADSKAKQAPVTVDVKPNNKRDHDAMSASSPAVVVAAAAPVVAAAAPPPPPVAEVAANERSSPLKFPCRMQCPHVFTSEKALCGHMRKHPGRNWKGVNPPAEASSSADGAVNGADDEAGGTGRNKKMKKALPFDLNELPPPEEDGDAEEKKN